MPGDAETTRAANVLGALALVVTDLTGAAVTAASGQSLSAAAAVTALDQFLDRPTIDDLRRVLGLTPSGAVRLVDRLCSHGLTTRGPGADGRSRSVALTPKGRRAARRLAAARAAVLTDTLGRLSAEQQAAVGPLVDALMAAVVQGKDGGAWTCRLCDLTACQRAEGRCPAYTAAIDRFGAS